ncbi:MAG: S41 family peptidase [Bacteroidales bacterium]|nr:S41 family peptidase [Bacteroidales bacterium]
MKKNTLSILLAATLLITSCEKAIMTPDTAPTAVNTFEYLWHKVDQQYSMFDVKEVDWGAVYDSLRPQVHNGMTNDSLFLVCAKMLNTLRDGHVNLYSSYDISRSDSIYYDFYTRSSIDIHTVVLNYLGISYHMTGGLAHNGLCDGQVIYIRYSSFSNGFSLGQLRYIINSYPEAQGMILDIRDNGGGSLANVDNLLRVMPSHGQVLYRSQIKSGPNHNDFTPLVETYAPMVADSLAFQQPVYVLIDRGCFSAASVFAISTQAYDNIKLVGDTTSGGLGLPSSGVLPNGWQYRFPVTRAIALDGNNYENGVPPDIYIAFNAEEAHLHGRDNIIDSVCQLIINQK